MKYIYRQDAATTLRRGSGRKKVFREVMTYENPSRAVLMPQPGPSCLVIVALRHFDVIVSWQLLTLGPPVTTD